MKNRVVLRQYYNAQEATYVRFRLRCEKIAADLERATENSAPVDMDDKDLLLNLLVPTDELDRSQQFVNEIESQAEKREQEKSCSECPKCGSVNVGPDPWRKWTKLISIVTLGSFAQLLFLNRRFGCGDCGHRW